MPSVHACTLYSTHCIVCISTQHSRNFHFTQRASERTNEQRQQQRGTAPPSFIRCKLTWSTIKIQFHKCEMKHHCSMNILWASEWTNTLQQLACEIDASMVLVGVRRRDAVATCGCGVWEQVAAASASLSIINLNKRATVQILCLYSGSCQTIRNVIGYDIHTGVCIFYVHTNRQSRRWRGCMYGVYRAHRLCILEHVT